jgi:hypothetical protein
MRTSLDEPAERSARGRETRARFSLRRVDPDDAALQSGLRAWASVARTLRTSGTGSETRALLADDLRIIEELERVLAGDEPGEGTRAGRRVTVAVADGRVQGVCSHFACPRGVFVELVTVAPWNLLRRGGAPDPRAVPGAGRALVAEASRLSRALGCGGRVALQAENPRARRCYERMGFVPMRPSHLPLSLVPRGARGWSDSVLRLARGRAGLEERRSPWMILDPALAVVAAPIEPLRAA